MSFKQLALILCMFKSLINCSWKSENCSGEHIWHWVDGVH